MKLAINGSLNQFCKVNFIYYIIVLFFSRSVCHSEEYVRLSPGGVKLVKFRKGSAGGSLSCSVCSKALESSPVCPILSDISNGTVTQTSYGRAKYQCNENYAHFRGDLDRYCLPNGTWSGVEPRCTPKRNQITFI